MKRSESRCWCFVAAAFLAAVPAALGVAAGPAEDRPFGQDPPEREPARFAPSVLTAEKHPHGRLAISSDGRELLWAAFLEDGPDETLLSSHFDGRALTKPVPAPFASGRSYGGVSFSPDGRRAYFRGTRPPEAKGGEPVFGLFYVERKGSSWGDPVPIPSTFVPGWTAGNTSVARNGTVYFAARVATERQPKLYACRLEGGTYGRPEVLRGPVNNAAALDPWIDPDERRLVFSSMRPGGAGFADLYVSRRQEDGGWGEPANLGPAINTAGAERFPSFSPDGRFFFFVRSIGPEFPGDDVHFYWVRADAVPALGP